ncbi:hypothetical protein FJ420_31115 [Mesorhizobium sp. B3-1-3]|uniref:hypothetical protein n=1 Tax=unclassified Mesorhizobium TaxID=325217 RepID=UPI0011275362|nr:MULTISPECIES: hypothetical protein [unclassified Mesorhizobium]TPI60966.1 hypothetical protein FJ420_31115 [Mesorhizobium sp. B3-1-3]TPI67963.1 hypothetical protein FJ424_08330 [Mesorhizobium sp. B3-1-8]
MELNIKDRVYCDVKQAVIDSEKVKVNRNGNDIDALPNDWGVQVSINLTVDETGAANPGLSFPRTLSKGGTFTLGLGGTLSSQATRIDKFSFYYNVGDLKVPFDKSGTSCDPKSGSSLLLTSNLGVSEWLTNALAVENYYPSTPSTTKQDVLSYEVKFVVISTGNVNPSWKLVRFSSNTGGSPLGSMGRTRTHDLLLTFGPGAPAEKKKKKASQPGTLAAYSHLASEIGLAIGNNIQSLLPSQ